LFGFSEGTHKAPQNTNPNSNLFPKRMFYSMVKCSHQKSFCLSWNIF